MISILNVADWKVQRLALIGFSIGLALGCLFGAVMRLLPTGVGDKPQEMLSVNARTGRAQLHLQGKPEIK